MWLRFCKFASTVTGYCVAASCWFLSTFPLVLQAQERSPASNALVELQKTPIYQASVQQTFPLYARPLSALWREQPLKPGLLSLQQSQGLEIFLDRRIDPSLPITVGAGEERADLLFAKIAEAAHCQLGFIESVAYFGPLEETSNLELTYWRAWYLYRKQLIDRKAGGNVDKAPQIPVQKLQWERLTSPQEILSSIERDWHIELLGKDTVPHDLWDAGSFSALSLPAQLCLVLAGFGLSAEPISATNQWKIIPVRHSNMAVLAYPSNLWKIENIRQWSTAIKDIEVTEESKVLRVKARVSEHYQLALAKFASALPKPKSRFETLRFTFEVTNTPAADVIDAIAIQLQLKADWQANRQAISQKRISLKVQQATVKSLIDELAKQSEVNLEVLNEKTLLIKP